MNLREVEEILKDYTEDNGHFKIIAKTPLLELSSADMDLVIPESDITIQTDTHLVQFKYVEKDDDVKKYMIKPGSHSFIKTNQGLVLQKFRMKKYELLESIGNAKVILDEADRFFGKLDVYKKLNKEPKRALLLASVPGVGKTCMINKVCEKFLADPGTVVIVWDTSVVDSGNVNHFFLNASEFHKDVKRMILVMEDIGGGSVERHEGTRGADSALLNLLDGIGSPFQGMPTFIIATTNNPENGVEALIDRPGRFDKVEILKPPGEKECEELIRFISKDYVDDLSDEEIKKTAKLASKNEFSVAHLQEIIVRSMLDDISILEATKQLVKHKEKFKNHFIEPTKGIGIGL